MINYFVSQRGYDRYYVDNNKVRTAKEICQSISKHKPEVVSQLRRLTDVYIELANVDIGKVSLCN